MQRIDGYYLYRLGAAIHPLDELRWAADFEANPSTHGETLTRLYAADTALDQFLHRSIFQVRTSLQKGVELLAAVRQARAELEQKATPNAALDYFEIRKVQGALTDFEAVASSELGVTSVYLVTKKGGYDTTDLIENGEALFQAALASKVPDAVSDIQQATRCIAFEVPTAAGFHLHRANESVLHKYYDATRGQNAHPRERSMGVYLAAMEKHDIGDRRVRAALKDIKDLHRNPLIHPDHSLESVEEAIDLLGAIRSVVGAMLKEIPEPASTQESGPSSILSQLMAMPLQLNTEDALLRQVIDDAVDAAATAADAAADAAEIANGET